MATPSRSGFEPVVALAAVLQGYPRPWFVSGGWAIDLFVGRVTREHEDIEVGAYFTDQASLWSHLAGWQLLVPRDGAWVAKTSEPIELPEFQVKARRMDPHGHGHGTTGLAEFDVFLNPLVGVDWVSRRHAGLRVPARSVARSAMVEAAGRRRSVPYLRPEVQLLYKAKYHRPKDDADFDVALPNLAPGARTWLARRLTEFHPGDPWLERLTEGSI